MKEMEPANFPSGMKPVEDALVRLKWLIDDARKYVDTEMRQVLFEEAEVWMQQAVKEKGAKIAVEVFELDEVISVNKVSALLSKSSRRKKSASA
jgi:hypothetical protein